MTVSGEFTGKEREAKRRSNVSRGRSLAMAGGGLLLGVAVSVVALFVAVHLLGPAA